MAYKLIKIKGELRRTITKEFYLAKEDLSPHADHLKMKDLKVMIWEKPTGKRCLGKCFRGDWLVPIRTKGGQKRRRWFRNLIILADHLIPDKQELLRVFRHELCHVLAHDGHGQQFQRFARACKAK